MSADILQFAARELAKDGGRARILRRRDNFKFRIPEEPIVDCSEDDLIMDHVDNGMPSDSPYSAPSHDGA